MKLQIRWAAVAGALFLLAFSPGCQGDPPPLSYLEQLPRFWRGVYPEGGQTLYCGVAFRPYDKSVNVEHVFPMSWVTRALGCGSRRQCRARSARFNEIEADMHNLFPALSRINERRGAMAYDQLPGERWVEPGCDFEVDEGRRRVEPRPAVRGDIARAMFYMADRYGLEIYPRQRRLLSEWHRQDPPDAEERRRNGVIERLQGNRNPYIGE